MLLFYNLPIETAMRIRCYWAWEPSLGGVICYPAMTSPRRGCSDIPPIIFIWLVSKEKVKPEAWEEE
jgi:hypothetical protein